MSLDTNIINVPALFDTVVDGLRATGIITSVAPSGSNTICQSVNTLSEYEVIVISGKDYVVKSVSGIAFTVSGTVIATTWKSRSPYYDYGHPIEMVNKLLHKDSLKAPYSFKKYPLIYLVLDLDEDMANDGYYCTLDPFKIVLLAFTKMDYTSEERMDNVVEPILYPIFKNLRFALENSNSFGTDILSMKKSDRLFWGTKQAMGNEKNILNDPIDAVELLVRNLVVLDVKENKHC